MTFKKAPRIDENHLNTQNQLPTDMTSVPNASPNDLEPQIQKSNSPNGKITKVCLYKIFELYVMIYCKGSPLLSCNWTNGRNGKSGPW